jgi:hypothetical protein
VCVQMCLGVDEADKDEEQLGLGMTRPSTLFARPRTRVGKTKAHSHIHHRHAYSVLTRQQARQIDQGQRTIEDKLMR